MTQKHLAVFVSGTGTLLEAIIDSGLPIDLVIADRPCKAIEIARKRNIKTVILERTDFSKSFDRKLYSQKLFDIVTQYNINVIAMAGFMTILSVDFFKNYKGVIINSHPSLLPDFKGHNAVEQALSAGIKKTGCTIHRATAKVDTGEVLAQAEVDILATDTKETLHERIKQKERALYPRVLRSILK